MSMASEDAGPPSTQAAAQYAHEALRQFGLGGRARLTFLREGENVTFRIDSADERRFALRVHRKGYHDLDAIQSEHAWMSDLARAGVRVPTVVQTPGGDTVVQATLGSPEQTRFCSMLEWIEGDLLHHLQCVDPLEAMPMLGSAIAQLHLHARSWTPPSRFVRTPWDSDAFVGDEPRWGDPAEATTWERSTLDALRRARPAVRRCLQRLGTSPEVFSLIHADLTAQNVLDCGGEIAIIDFDDCGPGWLLYDIAVALQDFEVDDRLERLQDALLQGYVAVAGELPVALELLPVFRIARRFARLGWMGSRRGTEHQRLVSEPLIASTPASVERFLNWADRRA